MRRSRSDRWIRFARPVLGTLADVTRLAILLALVAVPVGVGQRSHLDDEEPQRLHDFQLETGTYPLTYVVRRTMGSRTTELGTLVDGRHVVVDRWRDSETRVCISDNPRSMAGVVLAHLRFRGQISTFGSPHYSRDGVDIHVERDGTCDLAVRRGTENSADGSPLPELAVEHLFASFADCSPMTLHESYSIDGARCMLRVRALDP